jgi:hypothetical protein
MSLPPNPIDPTIVQYTALPIYIDSFDLAFYPESAGAIDWTSVGAIPTSTYKKRVWQIQAQGKFNPTSPGDTYKIVYDFNKVPTPAHLLVQFSGPVSGVYQYCNRTLDASCYITYTFLKKVLTLTLRTPDNKGRPFSYRLDILDIPPSVSVPRLLSSNQSSISTSTSSGTENIVLTNNTTSLYFYYLGTQTSGGIYIDDTLAANDAFFNTYYQILYPGQSVTVTCTVSTSPYYGFVTFNAYTSYNGVSIGVFSGQVQFEYSGGDPTTMAPNYLNGYYLNNSSCPQIGTLSGTSTGFNPFFNCSAVTSSNVLSINDTTGAYNIGLSTAFTNTLTWDNVWEVPSALATELSSAPSLSVVDGTLYATASGTTSSVVLEGCSLSGSEFSQAPTLYENYNSNQLNAIFNVKTGINCIRIPMNASFVVQSYETQGSGNVYAPLDTVTTSVTSTVTGTPILASASQLQLLDTIIYNSLLAGIPFIIIDLHSTCPISDLSNAVYDSGYQGIGWSGTTQAYGAYGAQSPMASYQVGLDFWTLLSTKYAGYTNVMFEGFNEPQLNQNPNSESVYEIDYWYTSVAYPNVTSLSQNVDGSGSGLPSIINQSVAGFSDIVSTIQSVAPSNIIIVSGTDFNASFSFLQNTTTTEYDYEAWLTWLTTTPNLTIGLHPYAKAGTSAESSTVPGYVGIPDTSSDLGGFSSSISLWSPSLVTPASYAPFGSPVAISTSVTDSLGWNNSFLFLTSQGSLGYTMCVISTESGLNSQISAQYGGDYLVYLYKLTQTFPSGQIHSLPWAFYASTLCYPSLIENPYYWDSSSSACVTNITPTNVASNLIGQATFTSSSCNAENSLATENGTFPGYGVYWQNPSSYQP